MMRKLTAVSTMGVVDYRSDKERTARSTRLTKRAAKSQAKSLKEIAKQGRA
ncbi:hypothetical protein RHODO2019_11075 [Rhodococcus antarcticus]|uniref:Uncharacterized protein n=1 Tax=Rhodococcus antarcticus TaxID=2987751 RepID=A0ABY6NWS5_9NOCA|nr:hypothetical protein [Rhodococcus antarcticus]UZJ23748.1 hypothetical protein RHODO2019_11075 [Rhodococcus antarcticus]